MAWLLSLNLSPILLITFSHSASLAFKIFMLPRIPSSVSFSSIFIFTPWKISTIPTAFHCGLCDNDCQRNIYKRTYKLDLIPELLLASLSLGIPTWIPYSHLNLRFHKSLMRHTHTQTHVFVGRYIDGGRGRERKTRQERQGGGERERAVEL